MLITLILRTIKPLCRIDEPNKPIRGRVKEEKCLIFLTEELGSCLHGLSRRP